MPDELHGRRKRAKGPSKSRGLVSEAFHEVYADEPSTVERANVSEGRKKKMRVAIALNKAREAGARIPRKKGY